MNFLDRPNEVWINIDRMARCVVSSVSLDGKILTPSSDASMILENSTKHCLRSAECVSSLKSMPDASCVTSFMRTPAPERTAVKVARVVLLV